VALCGYGGGTMGCNPFDWMEMLRRTPHGSNSVTFWSSMRGNIAIQTLAIILGAHVRVGNEDNIWDMHKQRWESVRQVEWAVKTCEQFGRKVATAEEARPDHEGGRLVQHGGRDALQPGSAAEPRHRPDGVPDYDTDGRLPQPVAAGHSNPTSIL
jgi:beta-keto acid cleavage enzyme